MEELRILELFSGIGGMHYAFKYAQLPGSVVAAMDINTVANTVYAHNHKNTPVKNNNIQRLKAADLQKQNINMILMSPPCQPHTRQGLQRDIDDKRSDALSHICEMIPKCSGLRYVLMENVKGFEISQARHKFIEALQQSGFHWREFILSPTQINVPNTRHRYYCIARKDTDFDVERLEINEQFPTTATVVDNQNQMNQLTIESLLEPQTVIPPETYLTNDVLNKRVWLLDIVSPTATNTMCFTKAYTHYSEGTGSVLTSLDNAEMRNIFIELKEIDAKIKDINMERPDCCINLDVLIAKRLELLQRLSLRYFTPREVARLMSFPESFSFPAVTTNRQKYRLLGNSINVCVVGVLIKYLVCNNKS